MEAKKSEKADLEWRKPFFFEIGLCVALALVLTAFDVIGPREKQETFVQQTEVAPDEEKVINTQRETPPPPPPAEPIVNTTLIKEVDDKIDLGDDVDWNAMADQDEVTQEYTQIEEVEEEAKEEEIFVFVEEEAGYPGGEEARMKFLNDNLVYPAQAREAGLEGKVFIEFVVEKDGRLTDIRVKKSVAPSLDNEAIRVVKMMPKWNPGKQRNTAVRSRFTMPINFKLN